jgi:hypothetical protein
MIVTARPPKRGRQRKPAPAIPNRIVTYYAEAKARRLDEVSAPDRQRRGAAHDGVPTVSGNERLARAVLLFFRPPGRRTTARCGSRVTLSQQPYRSAIWPVRCCPTNGCGARASDERYDTPPPHG